MNLEIGLGFLKLFKKGDNCAWRYRMKSCMVAKSKTFPRHRDAKYYPITMACLYRIWDMLSLTARDSNGPSYCCRSESFSSFMESFRLQDIPMLWIVAVRGCWCTEKDQAWFDPISKEVSSFSLFPYQHLISVNRSRLRTRTSEFRWLCKPWKHRIGVLCLLGAFRLWSKSRKILPSLFGGARSNPRGHLPLTAVSRWQTYRERMHFWIDETTMLARHIPPQSWIVDRSLSSVLKGPNVDSLPRPGARI